MKSKREIMGLAAILILIFHFYIPVTNWTYEKLIAKICYIGVDLFFFVSAYSLGKGKIDSYFSFIKKRFSKVYLRFFVLVVIAVLFAGYSLKRAFRILTGIEFFKKGGGSFLWFVIAILITYLFVPFAKKLKEKYGIKAFYMLLGIWLAIAIALQYGLHYTQIFIYINRLPIIFIGLFYDELKRKNDKYRVVVDTAMLALGTVLLFRFGATSRLNVPFSDMFYILAIPSVLSIVDLMEYICGIINSRVLAFIGKYTLELYGLQMIFGFKIEAPLQKMIGNGLLTFLATSIILIIMAALLSKGFELLEGRLKK